MTRILVNPDSLKQSADKLRTVADVLRQTGNELKHTTENAPSYDGQFGPLVLGISYSALVLSQKNSTQYDTLSKGLNSRANAFLAADASFASKFSSSILFPFGLAPSNLSILSILSSMSTSQLFRLITYGNLFAQGKWFKATDIQEWIVSRKSFLNQQENPLLWTIISSKLLLFGNKQNLWPERRGRPKSAKKELELKVPIWKDRVWEDEYEGNAMLGGTRIGYRDSLRAASGEAGIGVGLNQKEGAFAGAYGSATVFEADCSYVVGDTNRGVGIGLEAEALQAEGFVGYKDGNVGAKLGGTLISTEVTTGVNVSGVNVGISGEVGIKFEVGFEFGEKSRVYLGPFTLGLNIGEALGS